jgi:hypothetical protein
MAAESDSASADKMADAEWLAKECTEVQAELAELRIAYEQYFLGYDRKSPTRKYDALKRRLNKLRSGFVRQTALKFRVQSLWNQFLTYERLWTRTLQEMENGTYRRDLFKAKLHHRGAEPKPEAPLPPKVEAPAGTSGVPSEEKLKLLYQSYIAAKKQCNEDTSRLTFESVANTVRKQTPELLKRYNASAVDFKVVIKDGKALLRAFPK